jgi:hypothetical protein
MARDDWFRGPAWDEQEQAEFFRRLARARPVNRQQYRRIKAHGLLRGGDATPVQAARELLEANLADPLIHEHERVIALAMLARDYLRTNDLEAAEHHFRLALAVPTESGYNEEEEIDLAEILIAKAAPEALTEARRLLDARSETQPAFVSSRFRLAVARAKLAVLEGNTRSAAIEAQTALALSRETHSGFAKHPKIGLVEMEDQILRWLRAVALGGGVARD